MATCIQSLEPLPGASELIQLTRNQNDQPTSTPTPVHRHRQPVIRSRADLLANLATLDVMAMRTLNRCYLHPENKRCCSKCLITYEGIAENFHLKKYSANGRVSRVTHCKRCRNSYFQALNLKQRQSPPEYIKLKIPGFRSRAKAESSSFDITAAYLIEQWDAQNGTCFYTGQPIDFRNVVTSRNHPHLQTPSLDRAEPKNGYTIGNVVWCSYAVNRMKSDLGYDEFLQMCSQIIQNRKQHE
jgi:hypothetical protein